LTESERAIKEKSKAHVYKLADGTRVSSVTTILYTLGAAPQIVKWANKKGLEGTDTDKLRDELAKIGTLAHALVIAQLTGQPEDGIKDGYDKSQIDMATNCHYSFLNWSKGKELKPRLMEEALISEIMRFGGKLDFYGDIDGVLTLLDFKTGSGIYDEHWYQLAAYRHLLEVNGFEPPVNYTILNIPRAEDESFDVKTRTRLDTEWEIFKSILNIYNLKKGK
jgi:hypothetical protein